MEHEHNHGPGCGCGDSKTVVIEFDDDTSIECEIIGTFEVDDKEYVALLAQDGSEEILLYGVKESDNEDEDIELIDIEDEEEFKKAAEVLDSLLEDDS